MASSDSLPPTMKALVLHSRSEPPVVETIATPTAELGTAVVRVLSVRVLSYAKQVYSDDPSRPYPFPTPLVPGSSAIGRVAAVGPDATRLRPGQLVLIDCFIHSRDNPSDCFLAGVHQGSTPGSTHLMTSVYRNFTLAEYCRAPLEAIYPLSEPLLTSPTTLSYTPDDLTYLFSLAVPYGGLRTLVLSPGETILIAPATGPFGGAAVHVALALGARVVAMGRNTSSLAYLRAHVTHPERLETVPITGDVAADLAEVRRAVGEDGEVDAYLDIGPPQASNSSHIKTGFLSLRRGGRVSLMGGYRDDVAIPHGVVMHKDISIFGKWMYERADVEGLIKLAERGLLKLGKKGGSEVVGAFGLEGWKEAFDLAEERTRVGEMVVIRP